MWQSRKFRTLVLDAVFSTITMALGLWLAQDQILVIAGFVAVWQPIVYAVVVGWTKEDVALKSNPAYFDEEVTE